jgi:hypothetical protein
MKDKLFFSIIALVLSLILSSCNNNDNSPVLLFTYEIEVVYQNSEVDTLFYKRTAIDKVSLHLSSTKGDACLKSYAGGYSMPNLVCGVRRYEVLNVEHEIIQENTEQLKEGILTFKK